MDIVLKINVALVQLGEESLWAKTGAKTACIRVIKSSKVLAYEVFASAYIPGNI